MPKTIDGNAPKKAIVKGIVTRVVNLQKQHMVMLTVDTRGTTINGSEFALGDKITFKIDCSGLCKRALLEALTFVAVGDEVTIDAYKSENGKWLVTGVESNPRLGRDAGDWLDDVEAELIRTGKIK